MTRKTSVRAALLSSAALAALAATACSGGGGGSPVTPRTPVVTPSSPAASQPTSAPSSGTTAIVTIKWPTPATSQSKVRRAPQYLSNGTESVTIVVQGTTTEVDNPNLSPGVTSAGTQATSAIPIIVTPGTAVLFTVNAYDKTGGTGNLLGSGTTTATIVKGTANPVNITLNGNLASVACSAVAPQVTALATANTFSMVGVAGDLILTAKDPDGYTIITPGVVPPVSLTPADATMASATATSTTNEYAITVTPVGTAEKFNASGTDLNNNPVTTSCSVTRDAAMYVTNIGSYTTTSVSIYDATTANATGGTVAATPVATIAAPASGTDNTALVAPQFPAVDPKGNLFVTNQGPMPSATYGPTAGYVAIYAPGTGQNGNVAPIAYIPNLNRPEGIDFDSAGNLYVMSADRITEYPPTADGVTAPAVPSNTITGSNTGLSTCYGMHVDTSGNINVGCSNALYVFPKGTTGNVAPEEILAPTSLNVGGQAMTYGSFSWLDAAADSSGNIYGPGSNNNVNMVFEYMAGASSNTSVPTPSTSTSYSDPTGIFITPANNIYITNRGNNTVTYFASAATFTLGLPDTTFSGAATGLNFPFGVTVR